MTLTIEETPFLELILLNPLNPISEKIFKYDQIIHLITSDIVAFWAEASKLSESEITAKIAIFNHF